MSDAASPDDGGASAVPAASTQGVAPANDQASDYADAWNRHDDYADKASDVWNQMKKNHPLGSLIASMLPVTNDITSALELNDAYNHDDKTGMALAAAGLVPGVNIAREGLKAIRAGEAAQQVARTTLTGAQVYSASKAAGQAMKNKGAAKMATGVGTEAANLGSSLSDYIDSWRAQD